MAPLRALTLLAVLGAGRAVSFRAEGANPIRKVILLMQNMQREIEETGIKEKELYDKFMCYCSNNDGSLAKSVADAKQKVEELMGRVKSEEAEKAQNEQDLVQHKKDRASAEEDLKEALSLREKEKADFEDMSAEATTNVQAMTTAVATLEGGMGTASLLQTEDGDRVRKLVESFAFQDEHDRRSVMAFFQQRGDYAPKSGQIVGILKSMKDSMEANLKDAVADEQQSVASFATLKSSKESEVQVATQCLETKQVRSGDLAVSIINAKDDLEDTEKEATDTEKFQMQLQEQCGTKEKEWAERCKVRTEEVSAISDAISILNDDDAQDTFRKAVPSALLQQKAGFLQKSDAQASRVQRAKAILAASAAKSSHSRLIRLMLYTINAKLNIHARQWARGQASTGLLAKNFDDVKGMIDDMVTLEGKEQESDDTTSPWCNGEFDTNARDESHEKSEIAGLDAEVEEQSDQIAAINEEVSTLKLDIQDLDKAVAEATDQRKEEHKDYVESMQLSSTAVELVGKAKNRLQKFYNPTLYKAEPTREATMEDKLLAGGALFAQGRYAVAPPPPPEGFSSYEKQGEKSAGVMGLMDMIVRELESDMKDAEYEEKTAQKDYEELMSDSAEAREQKTKGIMDKEDAKSKLGAKKLTAGEKEKADYKDIDSINKYVFTLHSECDFILENYDVRKDARVVEVESLKNAKAVLSGAH